MGPREWIRRAGAAAAADIDVDAPGTPRWFTEALSTAATRSSIVVDDCSVHYRSWGDPSSPTLVLIHGGGAHSGWWDHIGPLLSRRHHVVAPDLSGHGDSGQRDEYSLRTWAREVLAVGTAHDAGARPILVGHSMGGWVASTTALRYGADIEGNIVIDSPVRDRAPEGGRMHNRGRKPAGYRSEQEIVSRFRVVPAQPDTLPYVLDHIAAESVRQDGGRWFWKFDPRVFALPERDFGPTEEEPMEEMFASMRARTCYVRCEHGIVAPEMAERIESVLQLRGPFIELAAAGHHPMVDQPLALVATLRAVLEMWSIT